MAGRLQRGRAAISAQEYPGVPKPDDGLCDRLVQLGCEPGHVGQGVNVTGHDSPGVGADDAADEGGVLVVLDVPSPLVWCQPGLDGGSPGAVANTRWVVRRGGVILPAPFVPAP